MFSRLCYLEQPAIPIIKHIVKTMPFIKREQTVKCHFIYFLIFIVKSYPITTSHRLRHVKFVKMIIVKLNSILNRKMKIF